MRKCIKIALVCILASLAGCGENAMEKAIEAQALADGVALDIKHNGSSISMTAEKDGTTINFGQNVSLPDAFPEDIKLYPGLTLIMASSVEDREMFNIQGTTPDAVTKVVDFYVKMAEKGGWKKETSMEQAAMTMVGYTKEERMLNIVIIKQGEIVSVQLTTAMK